MAYEPIKDIVSAWHKGKTVLVIIEHDAFTLEHITFNTRREYRKWLQERERGTHVAFGIREMIGSCYNQ